jgi:hypothetical protein
LTLLSFGPQFVRPPPPLMEVSDSEMIWLNPEYAPRLMWDGGMCVESKGTEVSRHAA